MKTITVRDLRQRWPAAEAALQVENEILITRDSKPVAKLVRFSTRQDKLRRWNSEDHMKWMRKVYGNKPLPSLDPDLAAGRADRKLI